MRKIQELKDLEDSINGVADARQERRLWQGQLTE